MKKYDNYKDSGIEWIGAIPQHWDVKPLKYKVDCNKESLTEKTNPNLEIQYIEIGDVSSDSGIKAYSDYLFSKAPSRARRIVRSGDVIISTVRTYLKAISSINESYDGYIASTGFAVLRPKEISSGFLGYSSLTDGFIGDIISFSKGVSYPSITAQDLMNLKIPLPSFEEQTKIANFLDQKTSQIDHLITQKQQLIALLQEERTAVINQAVTKGLDPTVEMKDSGIEWLGEIPKHWQVKKLKFLLIESKDALKTGPFGSHIKNSDYITDGKNKVYTQRNVLDDEYENGCESITEEKFNELKGFTIFQGDILITTRGSIGRCSIFPQNLPLGILHPCLIRIQINEKLSLKNWVVNYINNTSLFYNNVKFNSNSTIIDVIYGYTLKEIFFPVPSVIEQQKILNFLDLKITEINTIISKTQQEIELLKEYKTALISEVVTGKVDVRN